MNQGVTTVDFLRHGLVSGAPYYRGITDDPLTEKGWQQMHLAVANRHWDQIISSPLQRCQKFAVQLSQNQQIPLKTEPNWQEICFGDWEGKMAEQINSSELKRYYQDPVTNTPKNAENYRDFLTRIDQGWKNLISSQQGKHILVVTHAGIICALFHLFLDLPIEKSFNLQVNHAGMTRFQCFHSGQQASNDFIKLIFHNLSHPNL